MARENYGERQCDKDVIKLCEIVPKLTIFFRDVLAIEQTYKQCAQYVNKMPVLLTVFVKLFVWSISRTFYVLV